MTNEFNSYNVSSPLFFMPTTITKAVELKKQFGASAEFIAGGTLLQLQWMNGRNLPKKIISLEQIKDLKSIEFDQQNGQLSIGAITSLGSYQKNKILKEFPLICDALKSIAAPGIRNRGTIGGNIMGGVGDLIPFLLTLNAKIRLQDKEESRDIEMWDWLSEDAVKEQLLTHILIPLDKDNLYSHTFYRKIGRRETFTAALITVSGKFKWDEFNNIVDVKLAIGGGENKPVRLKKTEQIIKDKLVDDLDWKFIYSIILEEIVAVEDAFVTESYRKKVAANIIIAELQSQFIQSVNKKGVRV